MLVNLVEVLLEKGARAELRTASLEPRSASFAEDHLCQHITASLLLWHHIREEESEAGLLQQLDNHWQAPQSVERLAQPCAIQGYHGHARLRP